MEIQIDSLEPATIQKKHPGFKRNLSNYFQAYTDYTGIHGFKYMGEHDRPVFEKLIWAILFGISLYFCIDLIIQSWQKWEKSPVLVSFANSPMSIWQIPFPAVTICPNTKIKQTSYNFTKGMFNFQANNMTENEASIFSTTFMICDSIINVSVYPKVTNASTAELLMDMAPQFQEVLYSCNWQLRGSCEDSFTPIITEDGLCFSFNMLDKTELFRNKVFVPGNYMSHKHRSEGWTLEKGYPENANIETFPRRAMLEGISNGLMLLLTVNVSHLDYVCRGPVQGFKIHLHHPAEIPRVGSQFLIAPLNKEIFGSIKIDMMSTSEGLKSYPPHIRQCYFPSERYLTFFQTYTQQNCRVECLANFTLAKCGCVAYYMPREESTPICYSGSNYCMIGALNDMNAQDIASKFQRSHKSLNISKNDCDCLPSCISLIYNAEISQAENNWKKVFAAFYSDMDQFSGIEMTRITLFFKEQQFISAVRNELYGQTDFLANCGGLLGLFTGFSFLSLVEVAYFLSLRIICNVKMYGKKYWSASNKLRTNEACTQT